MAQEPKLPTWYAPSNNSLQWCLGADATAAVTAAASITPIIPVFIVWTLYAVTYFTANSTETLVERFLDKETVPTGSIISAAVFAVNTPLGVWKDVRFAQFFGRQNTPASPPSKTLPSVASACGATAKASFSTTAAAAATAPRGMPASVSAAFLVRDIITVFGSYAVAPQVSAMVPDRVAQGAHAKASVAQLIVPAMTQAVATPAHLLGLDLYNRPGRSGWLDRVGHARRKLLSTTVMRAFRLVPAFGVGIVFNNDLRASVRNYEGTKTTMKQ
ncbi:hypothetical protein KJ359_000474 [Pestalotiopsis sp. 9143b]|nr:hypothetical protein KJ359_000474 [Pestalotiopsis sp. 9143b]